MKEKNLQKAIGIGIFVLLAMLVFNLVSTIGIMGGLQERLSEIKKAAEPAKLELISIGTGCEKCSSVERTITELKGLKGIEIIGEQELQENSQEAKGLIAKYGITRLPAIVLRGEIEKVSIQGFVQKEDALVFDEAAPPYVDAITGQVVGLVSALIVKDANCNVCYNLRTIVSNLQQSSVVFSETTEIEFGTATGQELIARHGIKKVPALLISADIKAYPVAQSMEEAGLQEKQGYYLIESSAPYVETDTGELRGLVNLIMLSDESCQECYDVTVHKQILASFGLAIDEEKPLDISSVEGKELLDLYSITAVPTALLTGDVSVYSTFNTVWKQVGTIEDDNTYVFRNIEALGSIIYKDLNTNEIISIGENEVA